MTERNFQIEVFNRLSQLRIKRNSALSRIEACKKLEQPLSQKDQAEVYDCNIRIEELERLVTVA